MKDNQAPRDRPQIGSLMFADTSRATSSNWSAVRSALVAEVLRRENQLRVCGEIHGESMLPALWPGDVVKIESCSLDELRPGEIVLAQRDDRLVLHRLVADRGPNGFVLRGDSVRHPDPEYPPDALLGRLVRGAHEKRGRSETSQHVRLITEWLGAKWSRAVGILFCYCGLARRLALKLHSRRQARAARDLASSERTEVPTSLEINSSEIGSSEAGAF
jgi:hypothetical protein